MSYLVLARKSRPRNFAEVIGQRSIVKTLQNSIRKNRIAHAILFSGVRGVGKTTLARIMAKAINCQGNIQEPPCNECQSCREINHGASLDLHEIDGASNRGIQEIRELKEKIRFLPSNSKYKIIIIDEVHMLTTEAFNALLKTLEEPPEHVYFMFATTELHKIPITILSRCQQYELKRIPADELSRHFYALATKEGIDIEQAAMTLIVREAEGSVRDGLSLLDQVFSFGEQKITVQDVAEVLGLVNRDVLHRLADALLIGDRRNALMSLAEIFSYGMDIKRFSADLLGFFRNLLLVRIEGCRSLIDLPEDDISRLHSQASDHSIETLHLKLSLLIQLVEDLRYSSQPRLVLETGIIKLIEAGNVTPVSTILAGLEGILSRMPQSPPTGVQPNISLPPPMPPGQAHNQEAIETPVQAPAALSTQPPATPNTTVRAVGESTDSVTSDSQASPVTNHQPSAQIETATPAAGKTVAKDWQEFIDYLRTDHQMIAQVLLQTTSAEQDNSVIRLHFADAEGCALLKLSDQHQILTQLLQDFFGQRFEIQFVVPETQTHDPQISSDTLAHKRQRMLNDPLTQKTIELFNGHVADVRPK